MAHSGSRFRANTRQNTLHASRSDSCFYDETMKLEFLALVTVLACGCTVDASHDAAPDADGSIPADDIVDTHTPTDVASMDADFTGRACTSNSDCGGGGLRCSYAISDGCAATGVCMSPWPVVDASGPFADCGAIIEKTACGCSGTELHWASGCVHDYADGYAPAPVLHMGTCGD
jgi:hypothetical protein